MKTNYKFLFLFFLAIRDKNSSLFNQENNPEGFSPLLFRVLSLLIALFHGTSFFGPNGPSLALSSTLAAFYCFLSGISFCVVAAVPRVLRIRESVFYPQAFFTLYSFPIFSESIAITCVYQGFPKSRQLFLEGCRASHCG